MRVSINFHTSPHQQCLLCLNWPCHTGLRKGRKLTDEHLVTLGKYQQQFLGSLHPKREIEPEPVEKALVNEEREEGGPKFQRSESSEKNGREELIQSLIRSNG